MRKIRITGDKEFINGEHFEKIEDQGDQNLQSSLGYGTEGGKRRG